MVDLCITGSISHDAVQFSLNGETKTVDPFSGKIHFSLEEGRTYRICFQQTTPRYIPRCAEILLDILFLPVRGVVNAITFHTEPGWEKDISAFRLSGYIDIHLREDTEISFHWKPGTFDKMSNRFLPPQIFFSPDVVTERTVTPDVSEISKKHCLYLQNVLSVSTLLFALLLYLLFAGWKNGLSVACTITSVCLFAFGALVIYLVVHSFRKKGRLAALLNQQDEKHT